MMTTSSETPQAKYNDPVIYWRKVRGRNQRGSCPNLAI